MNIYELLKFVAVFNIPAVKDMKRAHLRHVSGCALEGRWMFYLSIWVEKGIIVSCT